MSLVIVRLAGSARNKAGADINLCPRITVPACKTANNQGFPDTPASVSVLTSTDISRPEGDNKGYTYSTRAAAHAAVGVLMAVV